MIDKAHVIVKSEPIATSTIRYTFTANERLKSKKLINKLFKQGKVLKRYPIRMVYLPCNAQTITHHQALFVVPKKKFKSAVARNTIKRRIREAHRLHKHLLAVPKNASIHFLIGYIYIGSSQQSNFQTIQEKVIEAINHLKKRYEKELLA